jgi:molecular chaperone GrpE
VPKNKKQEDLEQQLGELTLDLQRTRADFENYRKRVESEKQMARASGRVGAIAQLLPVIDTVERAIVHVPDDLKENAWVSGIVGLSKKLEKSLSDLGVKRINAEPGTPFNPELHEAVQFDESEGEHEIIAEELQAGYMLGSDVLRHSMVKVTRQ